MEKRNRVFFILGIVLLFVVLVYSFYNDVVLNYGSEEGYLFPVAQVGEPVKPSECKDVVGTGTSQRAGPQGRLMACRAAEVVAKRNCCPGDSVWVYGEVTSTEARETEGGGWTCKVTVSGTCGKKTQQLDSEPFPFISR